MSLNKLAVLLMNNLRKHSLTESNLSKEKSAAEREQDLWIASEKYMRGEIHIKKLEEIELPDSSDFKAATLAISRDRMRWFFVVVLTIWTLTAIATPVVAFSFIKSPLSFPLFAVLTSPIYFWCRFAKYLFPLDEKRFQLESMKIQKKAQRSSKLT